MLPQNGYTAIRAESSFGLTENPFPTPRSGADLAREGTEQQLVRKDGDEDLPTRKMSTMELKQADFKNLIARAERESPEYRNICLEANVSEDIPCDCWGALVFVIVKDLPDLRAGRAAREGKVRTAFCFIVFAINMAIQTVLLWYIWRLLTIPGMLQAQNLYRSFHEKGFSSGELDIDRFNAMREKPNLCGMALSQGLFVRVILFLWVSTNVEELRDNANKSKGTWFLPSLPEGLDTRLMVRDLPHLAEADNDFCVVCLNWKGKVGLFVLVFIPKFIIALLLTFTGCLWLMASENIGDLILNSLALAFVVKVDELIGRVFFPQKLQDHISNLALVLPCEADEKDADARMEKRTTEFFEAGMVLFTTIALVEIIFRFQPVIPNYAGDVGDACISFIDTQVPWCLPGQKECFPTA